MLGRLTLEAFPHDPIVIGATVFIALVGISLISLLTYFQKWSWLWNEWLTSLDHKKIGVMYIITAVVMLLRGTIDAVMMRGQQAIALGDSHGYLPPDHFDQLFSAHGVIMIFFVAMPLMFGLINVILPLQLGSRDVAFPFLNSLSFWLFAAGAILINCSLILGEFGKAGWLAYPPLSELQYSPGVGIDYYIWVLQISGIGSLLSGINFLVTIIKMRAPGMTLMRMPIFAWTTAASMVLIIFVFPILTATLAMLSLDRTLGMHFFTSSFGGNPMMYINLIWAWGHPEVYILILPAFGIFSEIVATFSRKRLFGYTSMVSATVAIMFLSFVVWLHHFFTMGAGGNVNAFFGIMTMIIAIPTGVKIFNWLFTMFRGRIHFTSPMHWFFGFVTTFTIGGMTGVLLSIPPADFQLHNSLFLVAHFHNMVIGGVVFGYFAGISYWFPKIFGFTLHERLGKAAFWFWLVGFLVAFIPLYILGLMGATRRLDHYTDPSWQPFFIIAAVGVGIIGIGLILQVVQFIISIAQRRKNMAGNDPWGGRTLEWSIPSPAPFYNFARIPHVYGRDAFWAAKHSDTEEHPQPHEDIVLPKNTALGIYASAFGFIACFALVWHLFWLVPIGIVGALVVILLRTTDENIHYVISAYEVEHLEKKHRRL